MGIWRFLILFSSFLCVLETFIIQNSCFATTYPRTLHTWTCLCFAFLNSKAEIVRKSPSLVGVLCGMNKTLWVQGTAQSLPQSKHSIIMDYHQHCVWTWVRRNIFLARSRCCFIWASSLTPKAALPYITKNENAHRQMLMLILHSNGI